ncbi:MAG: hypothetical protein QG589_275 [Patescibacteria group bacterium]|nr:hypothetical protein [Patescibacteria group bacterium]
MLVIIELIILQKIPLQGDFLLQEKPPASPECTFTGNAVY